MTLNQASGTIFMLIFKNKTIDFEVKIGSGAIFSLQLSSGLDLLSVGSACKWKFESNYINSHATLALLDCSNVPLLSLS